MESAQAELGAAIEPVTTAWTNLKANALEAILPVVQWVAEKIQELTQWLKEHETAATIITGVIIALAVALGVLAAAFGIATLIDTVKTAFAALNTTMLANPIVLVIAAVTALVAAFIYLWNNCDAFREFWINLWEKIKEAAGAIADWFKGAWKATLDWFKDAVAKIKDFFSDAWKAIKQVFATSTIGQYFKAIWETIKGIFSVVKAVLSGNWSDAWAAIKGIVNTWRDYFAGVWDKIKGVFSVVADWFKEKFQAAKDNIFNVFSNIKAKFTEVKDKIFSAFDNIKEDFKSVGQNILDGIWGGITGGWDWLKTQVKTLATSLFSAAKSALLIKSPSRKFMYVGEMSAAGIGEGWKDEIPNVEKQLTGDLSGLTASVQASVNAESMRTGRSMGRAETGFTDLARAVGTQTAGINSLSASYRRGNSMRPVILQLDRRELGRALVDVGSAEQTRTGLKLSLGGA